MNQVKNVCPGYFMNLKRARVDQERNQFSKKTIREQFITCTVTDRKSCVLRKKE